MTRTPDDDLDTFQYQFRFAARRDGYFHIDGRIFNIENEVLIADVGLDLERKVFVAEACTMRRRWPRCKAPPTSTAATPLARSAAFQYRPSPTLLLDHKYVC